MLDENRVYYDLEACYRIKLSIRVDNDHHTSIVRAIVE